MFLTKANVSEVLTKKDFTEKDTNYSIRIAIYSRLSCGIDVDTAEKIIEDYRSGALDIRE